MLNFNLRNTAIYKIGVTYIIELWNETKKEILEF